jgi:S1-C subfamily serine protease
MADVLTQISREMAAAVAAASPGVVRVEARRRLPASGVVWSADGLIVTAHHVVEQEENIGVGLGDGRTAPAKLVGRDPTTDLALLRAEATGLAPPAWAGPESLRVGHLALALGRPGKTVQGTLGVVSALGEGWRTPMGGRVDRYLQTDAAMYPGFSGGPLIDAEGRVIGINTSALLPNRGLTVPTPTVRRVVETLLAHGAVRRGYLGVGAQPARLPPALAQQLGQETGLLVVSVQQGSPAEATGVLLGDTIVAVDGQPVRHLDELLALLDGDQIGKAVQVRFVRGGQLRELKVGVGEHP